MLKIKYVYPIRDRVSTWVYSQVSNRVYCQVSNRVYIQMRDIHRINQPHNRVGDQVYDAINKKRY